MSVVSIIPRGQLVAAKWMIVDAAMFTVMNIFVAAQVSVISPFLALFLRYLFGIPLLLFAALATGNHRNILISIDLRKKAAWSMAFAAAFSTLGSYCIYASLQSIPISIITSISFFKVIILIVFSAILLKEPLNISSPVSFFVGISGAFLITSVANIEMGGALFFAILSPVFAAAHILIARDSVLRDGASSWSVSLGYTVFGAAWSAGPGLFNLHALDLPAIVSSTVIAGLSIAIQFSLNAAFVSDKIQSAAPLMFLRLLLVTAADFFVISSYLTFYRAIGCALLLLALTIAFRPSRPHPGDNVNSAPGIAG